MKERPILFSAPMVRSLLAGTKTQTRRVVKPQPTGDGLTDEGFRCPCGVPGDRLWVRECFALTGGNIRHEVNDAESADGVVYRADNTAAIFTGRERDGRAVLAPVKFGDVIQRWRPSIFMPRWASRLTLEVTDVRVESLQSIGEADARAEGVGMGHSPYVDEHPAIDEYERLWNLINGARAWDLDPWVWVISFKRVTA